MIEAQNSRAERVIARCREIAACTDVPGEITRTFLSPSMHRVHELLSGWMRAAGMKVHTDSVGNLRGILPAATPDAPRLLIGSHLDTVADAGAFDGVLGVVAGVALCEELAALNNTAGKKMPYSVEVIGFSEEEGVRFAKPFLGSLALIGELDSATLARADTNDVTVVEAIRNFGLDPVQLPGAILDLATFAYLELHIEQGPVLESEGRGLAVVDAIAGQTRTTLSFTGHANHAGTTPMGTLRHDALAAAAEWIVEVERYAQATNELVATVGKLDIPSAAGNVIPGKVMATLDVRHADDGLRQEAVRHLIDFAEKAASRRGVAFAHNTSLEQPGVAMDPVLLGLLREHIAHATHGEGRTLTSGAGHDAMILARRVPCAMLFLRTPGGLSHHPDEMVYAEDVEAALVAGLEFLTRMRDDRAMLEDLVLNARSYTAQRAMRLNHA